MKINTLGVEFMKGIFENSDINIFAKKVFGFGRYVPAFHKHMELLYVLSGNVKITIDNECRLLGPGEISISFPYAIHSYDHAPDATVLLVLFSPDAAGVFEEKLVGYKPKSPFITDNRDILPLIEKVTEYSVVNENMATAYLTAAIGEIIQSLSLVKVQKNDVNTIQQILSYCSENYKKNISIKDVADALFISESYVTKVFSVKLGCAFRKYINELRISEAKKLLRKKDMRITDVMYECGYNNQSSFNRIFLSEQGVTPRQYKDNNPPDKEDVHSM